MAGYPRCYEIFGLVIGHRSAAHNEFPRYRAWLRSKAWWAAVDSNHLPPRYQHGALPVELAAQGPAGRAGSNPGIVSLKGRLIRVMPAPLKRPGRPHRRSRATRGRWQGRKDSNLGPSVLETDALTRLSYAPIRLEARRARGPADSNSSRRPKALLRARLASCDAGNGS